MAFSLLTHTAAGSVASNTVTTTAISTTGATIIAIALADAVSVVPGDLTDSASNVYVFTPTKAVGSDQITIVLILNPTTSGTHTFTYTQASSFPSIAVACFSGTLGGLQAWTAGSSSSTTTVQPGILTPRQDNALILSAYTNNVSTGSPTFSIDSSFTKTDQIDGATTPTAVALAYLVQSAAAAVNPTWTTTASGNNIASQVVVNLASAGVSAGTTGYGFAG